MKLFTSFTLCLAVIFCFSQSISAQTVNKGAWMVGGSAEFSSLKYKDDNNSHTYFSIAPNVGYYFMDDLAVGLNVNFTSNSYAGNSNSSTYLGPWVRYYVTYPIFVMVGANLGLSDGAGTTISAGVGYSWFLNNAVAIEPQLFFNSFNNDGDAGDYSEFGLSIGVQAFIGRNSE